MNPIWRALCFAVAFVPAGLVVADDATDLAQLAAAIRALEPNVIDVPGKITDDERDKLCRMLSDDVRARLQAANHRETEAWRKITTREEWEKYRNGKIDALRKSLGTSWETGQKRDRTKDPWPGELIKVDPANRYSISKVVFSSATGMDVTGTLYIPYYPSDLPGILICPSHHNPKTQGELQDMGMTWARRGCYVLVIDNLGHGERRQHPFRTKNDYSGEFAVGRQDYYFRYNVGIQLHLVGESLIGWMVHDLMAAIDVLQIQRRCDREKVILLGSVAGGGDPAAVTAALDSRVACVVPFNFGGPQPETRYPLPDDAENTFNYAGSGSWESTRNLRLSARDGFLPWVIVGSVAPRALIHAHEFAWDKDRDPVWQRYQQIFGFYDAVDRLSFTHGFGGVAGRPPDASHCNNIGPVQRKAIYPALEKWFNIKEPEEEYSNRLEADTLQCLPEGENGNRDSVSAKVHFAANALAARRGLAAAWDYKGLSKSESLVKMRHDWSELLGEVSLPIRPPVVSGVEETHPEMQVSRMIVHIERGIVVPALLLTPKTAVPRKLPLVVGVAQGGKAGFLRERSQVIASLLKAGVAVCLPDLRGTGETRPGDGRGRRSAATSISSSELMLGQTMVGSRLKDLRTLLAVLRARPEIDAARIGLWGDSFAPFNARDRNLNVPLDAADFPDQSEPLGHLLVLLGGLYEEDIAVVASARGGLWGYQSVLESQFMYLPHDVVVPGARVNRDLNAIAAALAPRPLWMGGLVDGLNRRLTAEDSQLKCEGIHHAYEHAGSPDNFVERQDAEPGEEFAQWLIAQLQK
jgi:cephalosporin-C deacetylase-like acetyl esterase